MPTIDQLVQLSISTSPTGFSVGAFNIPLFVTPDTPVDTINFVAPSYREYTSLAAVATDFGSSSNTYKAVSAMMSQDNKPPKWYIYARTANIAQVKTLTLSDVVTTGAKINGKVNGLSITEVPFNTDHATTMADLDTAITAMKGVSSVTVSGNVLTVTANSGVELDLSDFAATLMADPPDFTVAITTAGYNSVNAINDMLLYKKDFRAIYHVTSSENLDTFDSIARHTEANGRIFYCNSSDTDIKSNTSGNLLANWKAKSLSRTMFLWHHLSSEFAGAAMMGKLITSQPGRYQAAWKNLKNVSVSSETDLSVTQESNILANNGSVYRAIDNNVNILWRGRMTNGKNWDIINDTDFAMVLLKTNALNVFVNNDKPGFDDDGIGLMEKALREALDDLEQVHRILLKGSSTFLRVPKRTDFTSVERAEKLLTGFEIYCEFTGSYDSFAASIQFVE